MLARKRGRLRVDREILAEIFALGETANIEFERCGQYPRKDTFETVCSLVDTLHERGDVAWRTTSRRNARSSICLPRSRASSRNLSRRCPQSSTRKAENRCPASHTMRLRRLLKRVCRTDDSILIDVSAMRGSMAPPCCKINQ